MKIGVILIIMTGFHALASPSTAAFPSEPNCMPIHAFYEKRIEWRMQRDGAYGKDRDKTTSSAIISRRFDETRAMTSPAFDHNNIRAEYHGSQGKIKHDYIKLRIRRSVNHKMPNSIYDALLGLSAALEESGQIQFDYDLIFTVRIAPNGKFAYILTLAKASGETTDIRLNASIGRSVFAAFDKIGNVPDSVSSNDMSFKLHEFRVDESAEEAMFALSAAASAAIYAKHTGRAWHHDKR